MDDENDVVPVAESDTDPSFPQNLLLHLLELVLVN